VYSEISNVNLLVKWTSKSFSFKLGRLPTYLHDKSHCDISVTSPSFCWKKTFQILDSLVVLKLFKKGNYVDNFLFTKIELVGNIIYIFSIDTYTSRRDNVWNIRTISYIQLRMMLLLLLEKKAFSVFAVGEWYVRIHNNHIVFLRRITLFSFSVSIFLFRSFVSFVQCFYIVFFLLLILFGWQANPHYKRDASLLG